MSKKEETRRTLVPFNPFFFEEQKKEGAEFSIKETFNKIYHTNHWSSKTSISGLGSESAQTEYLLIRLRNLIKELKVRHLLDIPCGDFNWMKHLQVPDLLYTGGDIVQEITARNTKNYGSIRRKFFTVDITTGRLADADLLLCRDCLVHLSFNDIFRTFRNIRRHRIRYFLSTTFPDCRQNEDIVTGDWRPLNLMLPPFSLPEPVELINEKCTEGDGAFRDKSLGLWKTDQLDLF